MVLMTTERFYLRPAARTDAASLHQLRMDILQEIDPEHFAEVDQARELNELIQILVDPGVSGMWLAELNGEIVGYVRADALGAGFERMLALVWIAVRADVRGRGYGTKLLTAALGDLEAFALAPGEELRDANEGESVGRIFLRHHGFEPASDESQLTVDTLIGAVPVQMQLFIR